ncbi:hypothetical protein E2P81_ATG01040 [Venturia nashicola]|nr:hypothetical protein E2P81_ATG01040 [Venturia nashicola]
MRVTILLSPSFATFEPSSLLSDIPGDLTIGGGFASVREQYIDGSTRKWRDAPALSVRTQKNDAKSSREIFSGDDAESKCKLLDVQSPYVGQAKVVLPANLPFVVTEVMEQAPADDEEEDEDVTMKKRMRMRMRMACGRTALAIPNFLFSIFANLTSISSPPSLDLHLLTTISSPPSLDLHLLTTISLTHTNSWLKELGYVRSVVGILTANLSTVHNFSIQCKCACAVRKTGPSLCPLCDLDVANSYTYTGTTVSRRLTHARQFLSASIGSYWPFSMISGARIRVRHVFSPRLSSSWSVLITIYSCPRDDLCQYLSSRSSSHPALAFWETTPHRHVRTVTFLPSEPRRQMSQARTQPRKDTRDCNSQAFVSSSISQSALAV